MENLIIIAVIGLAVGIVSNLLPLFGNTLINFILAVLLTSIHSGLQAIGLNGFSPIIIVFIQWYFIGTFGIKLLSILPIPIISPFAQTFAGD